MTLRVLSDIFSEIHDFISSKGEWDFRTVYAEGDIVGYKNSYYTARTAINQSQSYTTIGHDNFTRANTLDGWGTASDGNPWVLSSEALSGTTSILSNKGVIKSADAGTTDAFAELFFGNTELSTANIEVLIQLSVTGTQDWTLDVLSRTDLSVTNLTATHLLSDATDASYEEKLYSSSSLDEIDRHYYNPSILPIISGTSYLYRIQLSGYQTRTKLWKQSLTEPTNWDTIIVSNIAMANNYLALAFDTFYSNTAVLNVIEFTVLALPIAPDVNTTNWSLIG